LKNTGACLSCGRPDYICQTIACGIEQSHMHEADALTPTPSPRPSQIAPHLAPLVWMLTYCRRGLCPLCYGLVRRIVPCRSSPAKLQCQTERSVCCSPTCFHQEAPATLRQHALLMRPNVYDRFRTQTLFHGPTHMEAHRQQTPPTNSMKDNELRAFVQTEGSRYWPTRWFGRG
jgi:hypothetical protein